MKRIILCDHDERDIDAIIFLDAISSINIEYQGDDPLPVTLDAEMKNGDTFAIPCHSRATGNTILEKMNELIESDSLSYIKLLDGAFYELK